MKALTFIAITLLSGLVAGTVLGLVNQGVVEPYLSAAIDLENQAATAEGEIINPSEFATYRIWQRSGSIAAGAVLGMSLGALFGIVFAYGRNALPGSTNLQKALALAGIMWLALYLVPALKYPANPPAVGDPETIYLRQGLYIAIIAISGFAALALGIAYKKMPVKSRRFLAPAIYTATVAAAFFALPANPDAVNAPADLVGAFRIASGATMTMFWLVLGTVLGALWDRTKPHEAARIKAL
ncbi:CbtA family protein [Nitrososphaera sp.]|uniref:CbtA family protein n=1 Tax=Nitrososphaera sp. TaxID=1971748 RepID=UPI0017EE3234|nr:CbtA family protein [Nitrososphaera sp.]NWG36813.1 CbtA family protein [Nitrososphaera sp.]